MKVSTVHMQAIAKAIEPLDTPERRTRYIERRFERAGKVNDLDKRYRWDLFWESKAYRVYGDTVYMNAHLDTALRHLVPPLGGNK